jgi:hypothetical protein
MLMTTAILFTLGLLALGAIIAAAICAVCFNDDKKDDDFFHEP